MLKYIFISILSIIAVSIIGVLLSLAESQLVITFVKDINIRRNYTGNNILYDFKFSLILTSFLFIWYLLFFKWIFKRFNLSTLLIAIFTGVINVLILYIISHTLVMVAPQITDVYYLISLLKSFLIGFILPYSESIFKRFLLKK